MCTDSNDIKLKVEGNYIYQKRKHYKMLLCLNSKYLDVLENKTTILKKHSPHVVFNIQKTQKIRIVLTNHR